MIKEYDKVKLMTGEIARISEVLKEDTAYIADIFKDNGEISIEPINHEDIQSIFVETEQFVRRAV